MDVNTAEFAAITDRVAATEAKVSALLQYMQKACAEAGIPYGPGQAGKPAHHRPRHARPRGHLRLVPPVAEAYDFEITAGGQQ
jgi:hypothetical protein